MQGSMISSNNISNRPTLTHTSLSMTGARRGIVGRTCRIQVQRGNRSETQQLSQPSSRLVVLHELSFSLQSLFGHTFGLIYGPCRLLKDFASDDRAVGGQRDRQGSGQPVFQHPHASDGAFVAVVEVLQKVRLTRQRQVALKGEGDTLERNIVFSPIRAVTREVNINTAPAQLSAQVAKRKELVGPDQHMDGVGEAGKRLNGVKLVLELAAALDLGEMLRLVDEKRSRAAVHQCAFESEAYFQAH